jgi:membrane-associated protease RseP (regulator of RpoE activity)
MHSTAKWLAIRIAKRLARCLAAAVVLALASLAAGCVSFPAEGGTLWIQGRTIPADEESGTGGGVEVLSVAGGSPLAAEGIRRGDVITALEGTPVATMDDLVERVYLAGSTNPLRVAVGPPGSPREVSVVPVKASRKVTLSLGIPLFFRIDGDVVSFPVLGLLSVGTGPDVEGVQVLDCVGYWNDPESRRVSLVVLGFGTRISPGPPEPAE